MNNVEKLPVKTREDGPAVTLIGTDLPDSYLDEAEPSPLMRTAEWWWARGVKTLKVFGILAIVAFYPALVAGSHDIKDEPVVLSAERPWTSPETGIIITMITIAVIFIILTVRVINVRIFRRFFGFQFFIRITFLKRFRN